MKKRSLFGMFLIGFFKSFLLVALLLVVGMGSYKLTMMYYHADTKIVSKEEVVHDIVKDAKADAISMNLLYGVDSKLKGFKNIVLEIFHSGTYNLDYVLIPTSTKFTMSNELYQRLSAVNTEVPQIITLSDLPQYFKDERVFEYGMLLVEDLLSTNLSYYTAMDEDSFNAVFEVTDKDGNEQIGFTKEYQSKLASFTSEETLKEYLTTSYDTIKTNLTLKNKLSYVPSYLQINPERIYFHRIPGMLNNSGYSVDIEEAATLIAGLRTNEAYQVPQSEQELTNPENAISSVGLNIQILNGSKVSGLAGQYKDKLTLDGYTVSGVSNYNGVTAITHTKILTKDKTRGYDLLRYFTNATVEEAQLETGVDIQIILSAEDANN